MDDSYDDVVKRVARCVGEDDPSKIRLTYNCFTHQPKPNTIKYRSIDRVFGTLENVDRISDILYYEVLDIPLPESELLKTLKVSYQYDIDAEAKILNIRLPKESTVADMLDEIKTKVVLSHPSAELRLLEILDHKIYRTFLVDEKIQYISDQYRTLRAEEISEEEKNLEPDDLLIHVYHYMIVNAHFQMKVQNFGEPFLLVVHEGESLAMVKMHIKRKLLVEEEEFSKWTFAIFSSGLPEYLEDWDILSNRFQRVNFRALEEPEEDEFYLELAMDDSYDDVVERVARCIGEDDPSKIRLTSHNCFTHQPKPNPIKYRSVDRVFDMLENVDRISDILYYEVLDIPLPELELLKTLKVAYQYDIDAEAKILNIRLPRESTVADMLDEIKTKVVLSHPSAELRLLEILDHKIYRTFLVDEKIQYISDQYRTLRAEEIPEEENNLDPDDLLIHVYHYMIVNAQYQTKVKNFGEPFLLVVHEGESLAMVKMRIKRKLLVEEEEFSKWTFAIFSSGLPEYLEDWDILSNRFQGRDDYGSWEQYQLGIEHTEDGIPF